ncbi:hypothetical protein RHECNPAF_770090 [Rhizobium etli CNPAF512]|nr:hypothetical protein RHECNPAF_770090 [Rhizobium etli CNPAF512]
MRFRAWCTIAVFAIDPARCL